MILVPKGMVLVAIIALLAAILPWAKQVSYAVQAVVLTPLVLILVDLIAPAAETVDYGVQRLADTVIGGLIVLVLGYFLWPRSQAQQVRARFASAMAAIADYFSIAMARATGRATDADVDKHVRAARGQSYIELANLRAALSREMAEPPPAGIEAANWFPVVAATERLCDRITAGAAGIQGGLSLTPEADVEAVASRLRELGTASAGGPLRLPSGQLGDAFLQAVCADVAEIGRRLVRVASSLAVGAPQNGNRTEGVGVTR